MATALAALAACAAPSSSEDGGGYGKADDLAAEDVPALYETYSIQSKTDMSYCKSSDGETCKDDESDLLVDVTMLFRTTGQDGDRFSAEITLCRGVANKPDEELGATDTTDKLEHDILERLGAIPVTGTFVAVDGQPALTIDPTAIVLGAALENPLDDDLPTDKDDERVYDSDGDGKAGVSIKLPLGRRIFFGARVTADRWQLLLAGDDSLRGPADYRAEVSVYGDTIPFVNASKEADKALGKLITPRHEHDVEMIPAGDTTCAQVISRFAE